jgi:dTDP-4-amino-4,6-dideoxygalactose transaminase
MTWISTAGAVARVGAVPVFVDVHPRYYTIDTSLIEGAITDKTKAIIPVHLYGLTAEIDEILKIARRYNLKVIEDAAQAHGAQYNEKKAGTLADAAIFSFYPGKNLGAFGDAGCIVTNDEGLAEEVRRIGNHGQATKHDFHRLGRNSRMDGIQAAVLSVKLKYLTKENELRRIVAHWYNDLLSDSGFTIPLEPENHRHVYHLYVITNVRNRDEVLNLSKERSISLQVHYPRVLPELSIWKMQKKHKDNSFPISSLIAISALSLPMFPYINKDEVEQVVKFLKESNSK